MKRTKDLGFLLSGAAILIAGILLIALGAFAKPESLYGSDLPAIGRAPTVEPGFQPRSGAYYYRIDFNSVNVGTACIAINRENDLYKVHVQAQTIGMVDRVYSMRYQGDSLMETDPLSPVKSKMQQEVKSTEKITTISFQENGTIKATEKKTKHGGQAKFNVRQVQPERFTLDPFSASYLVRALDWKPGVEKVFAVYTGKNQYELRLRCDSRVIVEIAGEKRDAWVIVPKVANLDPIKRAQASKKKPASMKIYVSADDLKDVLKIDASHTMGTFRVLLDRFDPADNQGKPVIAQAKGAVAQGEDAASPERN